ncbi:hypothetical protein GKC56_05895 [Neisseriaceae bacterium PsAf]|nr:hypothetical protein [Neisseriaceae bacterium PsAf]
MSNDSEQVLLEQMVVLLGELKKSTKAYQEASLQASQAINKASSLLDSRISQAIRTESNQYYQELGAKTADIVQQLNYSGQKAIQASQSVEQSARKYALLVTGLAILVAILLITIPSLYIKIKKDQIASLRQEYERTEYAVNVKKAANQYPFHLCDGKLCIKVDRKDPIWQNSKDYLIVK